MAVGAANYKSVKSILAHALDTQPLAADRDPPRGAGHDNIRGAGYFDGEGGKAYSNNR